MAHHSPDSASSTRRTLRALLAEPTSDSNSDDTDDNDDTDDCPARVVDTAVDALRRVETAAEFLERQGTDYLARAVVTAVREGDAETVRRGRDALATYQSFQAALDGQPSADGPDPVTPVAASTPATEDHFHPARGTVLGRAGKRDDR